MINEDRATVSGFGAEWSRFDNIELSEAERQTRFDQYFATFPWGVLPPDARGFDAGCGSGRWALLASARVGELHCVDASVEALAVARHQLVARRNCVFHHASVSELPFERSSMDFGYSLGVLHHMPDPQQGLQSCVAALKVGAPFLLYLYYRFDNRPSWFRALWATSNVVRLVTARLPKRLRFVVGDGTAALVYWPLARAAALFERAGVSVEAFPLFSTDSARST